MTDAPFPHGRGRDALHAFWQIQREVILGQQLDILAHTNVEQVYDLKTGSYTVRGPLRLGALLANANAADLDILDAFAAPVGIAFQLRDELLGTFGDPGVTGKPKGGDLRSGKLTVLVQHARRGLSEAERAPLERVLGRADAGQEAIDEATSLLESCGARAHVERELDTRVQLATSALAKAAYDTSKLRSLLHLLTRRDH